MTITILTAIIGILIGVIAIGLVFWLKKEQQMNFNLHEGDMEIAKHAYDALMTDFTNYQVDTDRKIKELENALIIKSKNIDIKFNRIKKDIPIEIKKVIGHIEFARPLDKK